MSLDPKGCSEIVSSISRIGLKGRTRVMHFTSDQIQAFVGYAAAGLAASWKIWNSTKQNPPSHEAKPIPVNQPEPTLVQLQAQFEVWRTDQLRMHTENKTRQDAIVQTLTDHRSLLDQILLSMARLK